MTLLSMCCTMVATTSLLTQGPAPAANQKDPIERLLDAIAQVESRGIRTPWGTTGGPSECTRSTADTGRTAHESSVGTGPMQTRQTREGPPGCPGLSPPLRQGPQPDRNGPHPQWWPAWRPQVVDRGLCPQDRRHPGQPTAVLLKPGPDQTCRFLATSTTSGTWSRATVSSASASYSWAPLLSGAKVRMACPGWAPRPEQRICE